MSNMVGIIYKKNPEKFDVNKVHNPSQFLLNLQKEKEKPNKAQKKIIRDLLRKGDMVTNDLNNIDINVPKKAQTKILNDYVTSYQEEFGMSYDEALKEAKKTYKVPKINKPKKAQTKILNDYAQSYQEEFCMSYDDAMKEAKKIYKVPKKNVPKKNKWLDYVKSYQDEFGLSYREAMKEAKKTYYD
jgi:hypothetical protein